jgi:hypothetical protein
MSESVSFDLGIAKPDVDYRALVRLVVRAETRVTRRPSLFEFCSISLRNVNTFVPETIFAEACWIKRQAGLPGVTTQNQQRLPIGREKYHRPGR